MAFRCVKLSVSWEPLDIIPWVDAFNMVYLERGHDGVKADLIWSYPEDYKIRSQYEQWLYPSIIVLRGHKKRRPERQVNPSLRAILTRDLYTCQYCGKQLTNTSGTRDHVIPKALGGPNTFGNIVASCKNCQSLKADKHPSVCGMFPKNTPKTPILSERFSSSIKIASSFERNSWKSGFKKHGLDYLLGE